MNHLVANRAAFSPLHAKQLTVFVDSVLPETWEL